MDFAEQLKNVNVELSKEQFEQFDQYFEILVEWNRFMNLTGITEYKEVQVKHFLDSLAFHKFANTLKLDRETLSMIDVGTGAGFPGLPIKIAFPQTEVVLLDSLNKRVKFLNEVIEQLHLQGITAVHARAEEGARNISYREKFDISVSRAVANLSTLVEYCLPFVKVGGYFIAYKSGDIEAEAAQAEKAVNVLGGELENICKLVLPGTDIERSFVVIKKLQKTSKKYPRKAGLPGKEPIM